MEKNGLVKFNVFTLYQYRIFISIEYTITKVLNVFPTNKQRNILRTNNIGADNSEATGAVVT